MIVHNAPEKVRTSSFLFATQEAVQSLVAAAMVSMAEGNLEMACDCPEDYADKATIDGLMGNLNRQAFELLSDTIGASRTRPPGARRGGSTPPRATG